MSNCKRCGGTGRRCGLTSVFGHVVPRLRECVACDGTGCEEERQRANALAFKPYKYVRSEDRD